MDNSKKKNIHAGLLYNFGDEWITRANQARMIIFKQFYLF